MYYNEELRNLPQEDQQQSYSGLIFLRIGVPLKGSFKGVYKGAVVGFYGIGAFIIRIGFGVIVYYK